MREHAQGRGFDIGELPENPPDTEDLPPFLIALAPVIVVIIANFAFIQIILPLPDTSYLAEPRFGATDIGNVRGVWAVIVALFLAIVLLTVC